MVTKSLKASKQVFYGRIAHSRSLKDLEILPRAALGVDERGIIRFIDQSAASALDACRRHKDFGGALSITLKPLQFLFPGLIDTHLHAPQWPNLAIGMEGTLREWVENYTDPIEESYHDVEKARRVYDEMVRKELDLGTTTVAYNSSIHAEATNILADTCLRYGQRAVVGKLCILVGATHGNWEASTEASVQDTQRTLEHMASIDPDEEYIMPCVQPRGGPYVPPDLMGGLGALSRPDSTGNAAHNKPLRMQGHMCETQDDIKRTFETHQGFIHYSDMYKAHGLLHERSILAHCIHLSDRDIDLLAETRAGVAHNPNSNTCLRDGECRVRQLLDRGVKVGLGTDCSAGYSTSMLDAMRQASNVSRHLAIHAMDDKWVLSFPELIYLATLGAADVLDMKHKVGNFEPGKKFDALVVDTGIDDCINVAGFEKDDLALVKKWVFMGDDRSIRKVYVNGKLVSGKDIDKEKRAAINAS